MSWHRALRGVTAFVLLVVLHFTLRPLLGWWAPVDFVVLAVMLAAVRLRPGAAAVLGFVVGVSVDSLAPAGFGSAASALCLVAFTAAWLKAVFFADNLWLNALFFLLGKWVYDLIYFLSERRLHGVALLEQVAVRSIVAAAVTAAAGALLLVILRPLLESEST
ncbi:MAG: hypothetical protein NVS1B4_19870 [Gemmatimonadaceae bacterium]